MEADKGSFEQGETEEGHPASKSEVGGSSVENHNAPSNVIENNIPDNENDHENCLVNIKIVEDHETDKQEVKDDKVRC